MTNNHDIEIRTSSEICYDNKSLQAQLQNLIFDSYGFIRLKI